MNNNEQVNMENDRLICNETNYPHDSTFTKHIVVKITVERCDKIKVAVSQIFDSVKSLALWSANIRKLAKDHRATVPQLEYNTH